MKIRSNRSRLAVATAVLLLLGVVAACGDDDDGGGGTAGTPPDTAEAGEPKSGGTVTYMHTIDVVSFDPALSRASSPGGTGWQQFAVFDALVIEDGETGEIIPQTAESLESDDATVWTLKIKPDITFSDGTPYDAEAVKYNWERLGDPANRSADLSVVQQIASMEVVDPLTLEITLKDSNGQFDRVVARRLALTIGSPTALQADPAAFGDKPVGAGPFVVTEFIRGNKITFERNPDYWNAPRPYIDRLEIVQLPDNVQRFNALQTGQATIITDAADAGVNQQANDAGFEVPQIVDKVGGFLWILNTSAPPFDDVQARRILAHATDKQNAIDTIFGGNGLPAEYLIGEDSPLHDPDAPLPKYDPDEVEELLEDYGETLEFTILVSPSRLPTAEAWQAQLSAFPEIKATIQQIDPSQVIPTISQGQFQAVSFSMGGQDPEPDLFDRYHSTGARNYGKYSNPEMDEALEAGRRSLDEDERKDAYSTVQQIVADESLDIWYFVNRYGLPHQEELKDVTTTTTFVLWDRLWLDQ